MRAPMPFAACLVLLVMIAGCHGSPKVTPQEAAIAAQTAQQMNASPAAAVAGSRYRTYRWLTAEEMVRHRLGYDPTMADKTRYAVEQAVDDNLADKGFQRGEPADFVAAFSNAYIDRNRAAPGGPFGVEAVEMTAGSGGSRVEAYSGMEIYRTPEEAFTIVFLDAQTRQLLWRGTGTEQFASEGAQQSDPGITAAVYRALDGMPVPLGP